MRLTAWRDDKFAGGKGINVSRIFATSLGVDNTATGFIGGFMTLCYRWFDAKKACQPWIKTSVVKIKLTKKRN